MHQFSPKEQEKIARALYLDLSQQDYHRPFKEIRDIYGLSSSSVNRLFVEYSARVLAEYEQRELGKHTYVALLIDGKYMRGRQVIFCMGITAEGKKQILVRQANSAPSELYRLDFSYSTSILRSQADVWSDTDQQIWSNFGSQKAGYTRV